MITQSFDSKNFRTIIDYEYRKGRLLESYFPQIARYSLEIKRLLAAIKEAKKLQSNSRDDSLRELQNELDGKRKDRDEALLGELEVVEQRISNGEFDFSIVAKNHRHGKTIYSISDSIDGILVMKQLQRNLKSSYKVKPANRFSILSQLSELLNDNYPKTIIRTDLRSFYESVQVQRILDKLDTDGLLSLQSRRLVKQFITGQYCNVHNGSGLPRGLGISAYLAEIYMHSIDRYISTWPKTVFWGRYVDDIVIVLAGVDRDDYKSFDKGLKEKLHENSLELNSSKTKVQFVEAKSNFEIEYLGYKFSKNAGSSDGGIHVKLSRERFNRYKLKIDLAFSEYRKSIGGYKSEKLGRRLLYKRLLFLATNTRLTGVKGHVLIGAYFSNNLIKKNTDDFVKLDQHMQVRFSEANQVGGVLSSERLPSFLEGNKNKRFTVFKPAEIISITKCWSKI